MVLVNIQVTFCCFTFYCLAHYTLHVLLFYLIMFNVVDWVVTLLKLKWSVIIIPVIYKLFDQLLLIDDSAVSNIVLTACSNSTDFWGSLIIWYFYVEFQGRSLSWRNAFIDYVCCIVICTRRWWLTDFVLFLFDI